VEYVQRIFAGDSTDFYETIARHETLHDTFPPRSHSAPKSRFAKLMQEVSIM